MIGRVEPVVLELMGGRQRSISSRRGNLLTVRVLGVGRWAHLDPDDELTQSIAPAREPASLVRGDV